jgi:hypothetical protein
VSICVATSTLDPRSIYPVIDPRRVAGSGVPFMTIGAALAWDNFVITVERAHNLSSCSMQIILETTLSEPKEIQAWNLFDNNFVDRVGSSSLGLPNSMIIQKAGRSGQSCNVGADTVILCRYFAWPRGRTALYSFSPQDFWDFWGGCAVTFNWFNDTQGNDIWGDQTPQPTYPGVRFPDFTLISNETNTGKFVVVGGAAFAADSNYLASMGLTGAAQAFTRLPSTPADGTLVREIFQGDIYVVFGGAKFLVPQVQTIDFLGIQIILPGPIAYNYNPNDVRVIPQGGTAQLRTVPFNGTLVKEQMDPRVFLADLNQLRWVTSPTVMDAQCLPWRHVRVVPDGTLANLPHGLDLT